MQLVTGSLDAAEAAALADVWRAAPPRLAEREGIRLHEDGDVTAVCVASVPQSATLNHAYGARSEDDVARVEAFYGDSRSPYVLSPARGADLDETLERTGFRRGYRWMKFARDVTPARPWDTDLRVEEVDASGGAAFGRVVAAGFGMPAWLAEWLGKVPGRPGWACFVSFAGDEPAGAAALHVAGETGWLGLAATLPEFRGRGSQNAVFAARVEAARRLGCTTLTTETGERVEGQPSASYRNILRAGFSEAYLRDNWIAAVGHSSG